MRERNSWINQVRRMVHNLMCCNEFSVVADFGQSNPIWANPFLANVSGWWLVVWPSLAGQSIFVFLCIVVVLLCCVVVVV